MIAFTRDFHVLTSRVPTCISAVLLTRGNLAKTWHVRTFRRLLIDHFEFSSHKPLLKDGGLE